MELKRYLSILWRRKWIVIATLTLTMIVVVVGTSLVTPIYTATTTLRVAAAVGGSQIQTNPAYYDQLLNTYAQIATSRPILAELAVRLKVNKPPAIQAEVIPNTELIQITVEDPDPHMAALAANTLASILIEFRQVEQAKYRESVQTSMTTVVETAVTPMSPSQPRASLNYSLGALVGLIAGLVLAFILENLDPRLYETPDIEEALNRPALARLPHTDRRHLLLSNNGFTPLAESARYLAVQLQWMDHQYPRRVLLLTGAEPAQGTSTTSVNLACALSEQGKKVAIVDCNARHPQLHLLFDVSNEHGLLDVLNGIMDLKLALKPTAVKRLSVLPTGRGTAASLSGLDPDRIQAVISELRQQFEYVLLDAPALTVADVAPFVSSMDGLLLVVRRSHVTRDAVHTAGGFLSMFEGKFVGSIVNEAETQVSRSYAR